MVGKISDLYVNIRAKTKDFKEGVSDVTKQAQSMGYSFSALGKTIAGVFAANSIKNFVDESIRLSSELEGVEIAFKRIGNASLLENLRNATKNTVSDLELMKAAVQANNFGIPLRNLGSLLEFAHQRAKDTGQSVDYLVQSIVLGIGRKSPLILDNLGISAVALREKFKGLGAEQKSVADVAQAVGEIASEAMSKVSKGAETSTEKTNKLAAAWTNFKASAGAGFNAILNPLRDILTELLTSITDGLMTTEKYLQKYKGKQVSSDVSKFTSNQAYAGGTTTQKIEMINAAMATTAKRIASEQYELYKLNTDIAENEKLIKGQNTTYWEALKLIGRNDELKKLKTWRETEVYAANLYIDELLSLKKELKTAQQVQDAKTEGDKNSSEVLVGLLEIQKKKIKDLQDAIEKAPTTTIAAKFTNDLVDAQTELENLEKKIRYAAFNTSAAPAQAKGKESGLLQSSPDYVSRIGGQLQGFADSYTGVKDEIISSNLEISASFDNLVMDLSEGLGAAMAGTENFGDVVINAMAGFMSKLGQDMIAVGMAGMALKMSFANPGLAIAAGITLMALAGAAKATMTSGVSGGGYRGSSSSSYNGTGSGEMTVNIEGVVKGSDIFFTQKNYNNRLNSTTGS